MLSLSQWSTRMTLSLHYSEQAPFPKCIYQRAPCLSVVGTGLVTLSDPPAISPIWLI